MPTTSIVIRVNGGNALPDNATHTNRMEIRSESSGRVYVVAQRKRDHSWGCSCPGWIRHRKCKHLVTIGVPCFEKPYEATLAAGR